MGDLLGLRIGRMLAVFHRWGMLLCRIDWLNMSVRILIACGPRCLRCMLDMPSGPTAGEFFVALMASIVLAGVNCVGRL